MLTRLAICLDESEFSTRGNRGVIIHFFEVSFVSAPICAGGFWSTFFLNTSEIFVLDLNFFLEDILSYRFRLFH